MGLGYHRPLYILALDHRVPPHSSVFGVGDRPSPAKSATIAGAKSLIADGFARALELGAPADGAGVLVDEEHGSDVARRAQADGWLFAMPAERSGLPRFELEHGEAFAEHIEAFDPTFVKALVRYTPGGDPADNAHSLAGLQRLSAWLTATGRKLLCELIVPPTPEHLQAVDGDRNRYETELRPALMRRGIADFQDAGIEADVWKIEGIDRRDDAEMVAEQARGGGRDAVGCVVLGQGASPERVEHWLRTCSGVPGYLGFAVGRTMWADEVTTHRQGTLARDDAVTRIATNYLRAIDAYRDAAA